LGERADGGGRPRFYGLFWLLLVAGWALGLLAIVDVEESSSPGFAMAGGGLLIVAGVLLLADGGPIMAALNERYALRVPRRSAPATWVSHRWMGALLSVIGAIWIVYGVAGA
jgi:hypothetical protein